MRIFVLGFTGIFLVLFSLRPERCAASDPAVALSQSKEWLRLGHYEKRLFGGYKSRVANEHFFLSPEGQISPLRELQATIEAFRASDAYAQGNLKQSVECAFPARRAWLVRQNISLPAIKGGCTDRDEWAAGLGAAGATLVFSSAYPNNPASMFGHTLLMLNHASGAPILNYGANFEARVTPGDSSVLYGLKGLLGLYVGEYSISPYYTKINEYNYAESRDIWEYELNLSQAEVTVLINHLWELFSQGSFQYYFLDKNCSFQLMALLEVAKPEWNLTTGFGPYTLPLDTIKKVNSHKNAIRQERMRPSLYRKMNDEFANLNQEQKKNRKEILDVIKPVDLVSDTALLDSVLTELDYRRRKGKLEPQLEQLLGSVLLRRTKLGEISKQEVVAGVEESPLKSHASHMIFPGFLNRGGRTRFSVGGRLSLHDNLDPSPGYSKGFSIDFARLKITLGLEKGDQKVRLDEFQLIDILSLYPLNSLDSQISWLLRAGTGSRIDFGKVDSLGTLLEGGPGIAASFASGRMWLYSLGLLYGEHLANAPKNGRYGVGGEAGIKAKPIEALQFRIGSRYRFELNRPWSRAGFFEHAAQAAATLGQNWQLRLGARTADALPAGSKSIWEWTSDLRWYF